MRELAVLLFGALTLEVYSQDLPCQLTGGTTCPTMICPNIAVKYICNVPSYAGQTLWSVGTCSGSALTLAQGPPTLGAFCTNASSNATCGPYTVTNTPVLTNNVYCLNSTLSVTVSLAMNGLVVTCSSYSLSTFTTTLNGNANISVVTPPAAPNITSLTSPSSDQLTVTWTSVSTATSYNVSINGSTPIPLPANANTYKFTGLTNKSVYIVSVVAINCAGNSSVAVAKGTTYVPSRLSPSSSSSLPGLTQSAASSTPVPTYGSSVQTSSNTAAVGIGVGIGVVIFIVLVMVLVVVVILVCKKGLSKVHSNKNVLPLPPKDDEAPPKPEGLIYADIGLPTKLPLQAPDCPELSSVTYSSVQHL